MAHTPHTWTNGETISAALLNSLETDLAAAATPAVVTAVKTAAYTAAPGNLIPVDATSGTVPITLPTAPANGAAVIVKKIDTTTNTVSLTAGGSDTFNRVGGPTTLTIALPSQAITVQYAGGIWYAVADDIPLNQLDSRYVTPTQVSASSVMFTDENGNPLTGKRVQIRLTSDLTDIGDIVVVNA